MLSGRHLCRVALGLFVLWGMLSHPVYFAAGHDQPGHCCDVCHAQHVPPLQAAPALCLPQPVAARYKLALNEAPLPCEPDPVAAPSRSPPAR